MNIEDQKREGTDIVATAMRSDGRKVEIRYSSALVASRQIGIILAAAEDEIDRHPAFAILDVNLPTIHVTAAMCDKWEKNNLADR